MKCQKCICFLKDSWETTSKCDIQYVSNALSFQRYSHEILDIITGIIEGLRKVSFNKIDVKVLTQLRDTIQFGCCATDDDLRIKDEYFIMYASQCASTSEKIRQDITYLHDYLKDKSIINKDDELVFIGKTLHYYHNVIRQIHDEHRNPCRGTQTFDINII